jgi:hypothetical protein
MHYRRKLHILLQIIHYESELCYTHNAERGLFSVLSFGLSQMFGGCESGVTLTDITQLLFNPRDCPGARASGPRRVLRA